MEIPTLLSGISLGSFFLFCIATIGLTQLIVESYILSKPRKWLKSKSPKYLGKLLDCHQCSGTWSGFIVSAFMLTSWNYGIAGNIFMVLIGGFAGAFLGTWAATYLNYLEAKTIISLESNE